MASNNPIKTRIQLKSDTEANWNKSVLTTEGGEKLEGTSFIPLKGEAIIYSADGTHPFSRLKMGNGETNVVNLPFIAAAYADNSATVNNHTVESNVPQNAVFTDTTVEIIDMIGAVNS